MSRITLLWKLELGYIINAVSSMYKGKIISTTADVGKLRPGRPRKNLVFRYTYRSQVITYHTITIHISALRFKVWRFVGTH